MAFTRKNVWAQGGDFSDPNILWYARAAKAMQSRKLADRTSWRFFGAIHGFYRPWWQQLGYWSSSDQMPSQGDQRTYWKQCQHGSWYFLPWHRGYLLAFEAILRDAISTMPGAPSDWALPYWNYFGPNQNALPPAFASPDWPDGTGDNPLFVTARYGPDDSGKVYVPMDAVNLDALGDPDFIGPGSGGSQGFGGISTGFSHGGDTHGGIESQPHDQVHGLVGGGDQQTLGLMSWPDLAGLDPIFWLHHANIDRLWEVWVGLPTSTGNPQQSNWVKGPASSGQRAFVMPMPGGNTLTYTPGDMTNLTTLGYTYDDLSSPFATPQAVARLQVLGAPPAAAAAARSPAMAGSKNVELLGASSQGLRLSGREAKAAVALDSAVKSKVAASLNAVARAATPTTPDRVFLNLENVRGLNDATVLSVYINVPEGEDPARYPDNKAGTVSLFGVSKASSADDTHAGNGLTFVLEITRVIDKLHLSGALDASQLHVRLVPRKPVPDDAQISVGRISIYRQGA